MAQEVIRPGTLLKAKDGSEFMTFKFYTTGSHHSKKSETPTEWCSGKNVGGSVVFRRVEDFRPADKAESEVLDVLNDLRKAAAQNYHKYYQLCREVKLKKRALDSRQEYLDELPNMIKSVENAITALLVNIKEAAKLTGMATVRGDVIYRELDGILGEVKDLRKGRVY